MKIKRKSSTEGQDGVWGRSGGKKIFFASWQQQNDFESMSCISLACPWIKAFQLYANAEIIKQRPAALGT